jgi:polyisoprenoid-binding protein YceI
MASTLTATAPATRTTWTLDPQHLRVGFAVRHLMISTVKGHFSGVAGVVTVDHDDFATATIEATVDPATVHTGEAQRDAHLRSADFFDVERFPTLTFTSRRVTKTADGRYSLTGDITIHGVTKSVTLDVGAEGVGRDPWGNDRAGFTLTGVINRRDFGLTWNQALEAGGVLVGEEVKLSIDVELIRRVSA